MKTMVYGTGRMAITISESLLQQGWDVLIVGRDGESVERIVLQYGISGLVSEVAGTAIDRALEDCGCLVNAAGPFSSTAPALMDKCAQNGAHYLDVSNEYGSLKCAGQYESRALRRGLSLVPGLGFGVAAVEYAVSSIVGEGTARTVLVDVVSPRHRSTPGVAATVDQIRRLGPQVIADGELRSPELTDDWLGGNEHGGVPLASGALEALQEGSRYQRLATRFASAKIPVRHTSVGVEAHMVDGSAVKATITFRDTTDATVSLIGEAVQLLNSNSHPVGILTPLQFLGRSGLRRALRKR